MRDSKKKFKKPSWTKLLFKGDSSTSNVETSNTAARHAPPQLLSDDDGLYLQVANSSEVMYLEYTPLNSPANEDTIRNPRSKASRGCNSEEILGEILEEEPLIACSAVPFQDSESNISEKGIEKKNPIRWPLRKSKSSQYEERKMKKHLEFSCSEEEKKDKILLCQEEKKNTRSSLRFTSKQEIKSSSRCSIPVYCEERDQKL